MSNGMPLSEAIRLGALLHPQGFFRMRDGSDGNIKTCAMGAALEAIRARGTCWQGIELLFPILRVLTSRCPDCGFVYNGQCLVEHLNDIHLWRRERIADFIEREENLLAPPITATSAEAVHV